MTMTEWEKRKENAAQAWSAMSTDQQEAIMEFMKAWQPIRFAMSEVCDISYNDLRLVDNAYYKIRNTLVDHDVEVPDWQ
jgi:ketopantoate reductase